MKLMRLFAIHLILIGLLNITQANIVQAQKASSNLPIDTFYFKFVKSSHFKIKLPKIEDLKAYEDLFNTYGKLSNVKIKSKSQQFLGDFKNVSRAKYVNGALNKAGLINTQIVLFDVWVPPVIKKTAPKTASQTAIVNETITKSKFKRRGKNKTQADVLNSENPSFEKNKTNPFPARPKKINKDSQVKSTKVEKDESSAETNVKPEIENKNVSGKKKEVSKVDHIKFKNEETGEYILILPKVANPEVYQFMLKDLGTVDYKKLPNEQWYCYLGFFKNETNAKAIIPKIKERGFNSPVKITSIGNAEKIALSMYKNLPPVTTKKSKPNKNSNLEKIDKSLFYRIELPPVSNPEIYFKAFGDIGPSHSEISPNGRGVYYIGEFQTVDIAEAKAFELEQRGLSNGIIVKFQNDKRIDTYSEIYTKKEDEEAIENVKEKEAPKDVPVKTHPKGNFQIRLKQVENPDVLKSVFEDVGKLKVGYLVDDSEYYFMGNYLFQKDAEKVIEQLKERGLTKFDLLNIMASEYPDEINQQKRSTVIVENTNKAKSNLNKKSKEENIQPGKANVFKIKIAIADNPIFYENILKHYGEITSNNNNEYFVGNYPTKEVAEMVVEQLKEIGIETPLEVIPF